tara:strand:- start:3392 stop:3601 length:210 start_codon:yes stop_codon:yes gene_type:complete
MANNEEVLNRLRAEQQRVNAAINTVVDMERNGDKYTDASKSALIASVTDPFSTDAVISQWDGTKAPLNG